MNDWDTLPYWLSEDWLRAQEKLDADRYCPGPDRLFRALDETAFADTRVAWIGQDPYPNPDQATGLAFSVPEACTSLPPTLKVIFQEYSDDLHLPTPVHGDLSAWAHSGVLLWNSLPSCRAYSSLSHDWPEWRTLTDAIIERLCQRGVVFVLVGAVARRHAETINYYELVNPGANHCITVAHPAAERYRRRDRHVGSSFVGSRVFSKVNAACVQLGYPPIDWRLP